MTQKRLLKIIFKKKELTREDALYLKTQLFDLVQLFSWNSKIRLFKS